MSFNTKHLSYEKNEPTFLRKLRSEYGDGSGVRNGRPNPRPTKKKDADDDDAPTYVDEENNEVISKEEYDALMRGDGDNKVAKDSGTIGNEDEETKSANYDGNDDAQGELQSSQAKQKQHFAGIGGAKKRKQAKRQENLSAYSMNLRLGADGKFWALSQRDTTSMNQRVVSEYI
ncbi:conserved hypothetical protein [Histoplasma mississippiense (nom. inval.)]|uniref:conserved hypothetical protein n=1 Tax=Ajellomyces capsulatus (strain NAm1 / WU24) TaxID=2059318 RepID=UPI000157BCE5|nr:conserved hypothetical protein [Histoplasma mississippiense (nom. inval.)]EDN05904.1 conserved hypothetical protein [Histoplasma mississippiense (nom. inval.)]